ncbi:MAG: hypoxanthine phosphoribosyltransferase [Chloroflexi bacterium]|nr:hypoxanthine phosphoribosyltransferase [Chloroflexota bacterium]
MEPLVCGAVYSSKRYKAYNTGKERSVEPSSHPTVARVLFSAEEISEKVSQLGAAISADYAGLNPLLVGVLRGTTFFLSDLVRAISIPITLDFIAISSYGPQSESSGVVRLTKDLDEPIEGQHVLLVEDIVDTGLTLRYILRNLRARGPASLEVCALLDRIVRRLVDIPIKYWGFSLPDVFVVGYGLDYLQRYRNLPYIGVLRDDVPERPWGTLR